MRLKSVRFECDFEKSDRPGDKARTAPAKRTATGKALTHYHLFLRSLFSWENPRLSAIAYADTVVFILAARYLDLVRYGLKLTWMVLSVTIAAEVAGRALFSSGFTAQIRPRKYYTVPKCQVDTVCLTCDSR